tara:strand:+ start:484 stop:1368 length:885 start_codon:yes stop_codon:yes gene_type:complete
LLRILLIYCDYGRLGNRLHTHANALAWCIDHNYNLINLSFSDYADLFKSSSKHNSGNLHQTDNFVFKILSRRLFNNFLRRLLLSDKWIERLACIINQIRPTKNEALIESDLSRQIKQNKINLVRYWDLSCKNYINIHQHKLRDYLRPNRRFVVTAEKIIDELRSKYDCVIGVHARRGDYATYLDGIHYHSWESYLHWANLTKQVLEKSGKKNVAIVICSDEEPPTSIPKKKSVHFTSSKEIIVDIHLLSLCDYNVGPPSSFGTWISWFGKVPRLVVYNKTEVTSLEQFEVCTTC